MKNGDWNTYWDYYMGKEHERLYSSATKLLEDDRSGDFEIKKISTTTINRN